MFGERVQMILKHAAVSAMVIAGTWFLPLTAAADEELLDCRDVDCFQRAACNRRVLAALSALKTTVSEHRAYQSPAVTTRQIVVQQERQDRLRSFWAPECQPTTSTSEWKLSLGVALETLGRLFACPTERSTQTKIQTWCPPLFARRIRLDEVEYTKRLLGRWEGWLSFHDDRSARLWFQITRVTSEGYVRACSDQGMVMGSVTEGVLELPRREAFAFGSRILLWRSPPHYDDLEGIVLLETEPGQEFDSGLVWLSRTLSRADSILPTDYVCQDKEILDRRKETWVP